MPQRVLELSVCTVDLARSEVRRGDTCVRLTDRETDLLAYLVSRAGQDVSRTELLTAVWGYSPDVVSRAVDATVARLRVKIEAEPSEPDHLVTAWGEGYRLVIGVGDRAGSMGSGAVPSDLDAWFGRADLMDRLRSLTTSGARLITLVGPGGIGKSRLAREWARSLPGGAAYASLADAQDEDGVVAAVADALGLPRVEDIGAALDAEPERLLILDNAEVAVAAVAGLVRPWLARAEDARILVTCRERLRVSGEHVVEVPTLTTSDATSLLVDRARAAGVQLPGELAQTISARLDGLPLALELAAAQLDTLSPAVLLRHLDAPLDLEDRRRDRPPRHASLRQAFSGTWEALPGGLPNLLARCTVFRGGFSLPAAEGVLGQGALPHLRALRTRSLLTLQVEPELRFGLLDTVRAFAAERLSPHDPVFAWHRTWFAARARQCFDPAGRPPDAGCHVWLWQERHNLRAALQDARGRDAGSLALALAHVHGLRGPNEAALAVCRLGLAAAELPSDQRGHLMRLTALAQLYAGDLQASAASASEAVRIGEASGDRILEGRARVVLGLCSARKEPDQAAAILEGAIEVLQQGNDGAYQGTGWANLATVYRTLGRRQDAISAWTRALSLHRAHDNDKSAAIAIGNLGLMASSEGDVALATERLHEALRLHRHVGDRRAEGVTLAHLGWVCIQRGDADGAEANFLKSEERFRAFGHVGWRAHLVLGTVYVSILRGQLQQALDAVDGPLRFDRLYRPVDTALRRLLRAGLLTLVGRTAEACEVLDDTVVEPSWHDAVWLADVVRALLDKAAGRPDLQARIQELRDRRDASGVLLAAGPTRRPWIELMERG